MVSEGIVLSKMLFEYIHYTIIQVPKYICCQFLDVCDSVLQILFDLTCFHIYTQQPLYNTVAGIQSKNHDSKTNVGSRKKMYRLYRKMTINGHFSI